LAKNKWLICEDNVSSHGMGVTIPSITLGFID
jgi:hypothetical protein